MNDRLFSIGEVAKGVGITRKTILNYEYKGLIKPDKKDGVKGNRYYTIDTFTQVHTIRVFQKLGLSLDEIRGYFSDTTDLLPIIQRIEKMRDDLNLTIDKLKERIASPDDNIKEISVEMQTVYCRTYNCSSVTDKTNHLRNTALEALTLHGHDTSRRMYFTEYHANSPQEVSFCVAVPPESRGEYIKQLPALNAISLLHYGAYENIPKTREKLVSFAQQNNLKLSGTFRNLYIEGPPQHKDTSKFITRIIGILC
ncbi:MAG: MerR family transcriptional regulator [Clostridia bacterium]|nr:MerR family transcriptional regulator [Clostridia bacterium]